MEENMEKEVVHTETRVEFPSDSKNEQFARMVASAYVSVFDPTLEELSDIKTAVSEAVTNCILHGYEGKAGLISMRFSAENRTVTVEIEDKGVGIPDVKKAMEPMYTTKADMERSGMGFAFMEAFMDTLSVSSEVGKGTLVRMTKSFHA